MCLLKPDIPAEIGAVVAKMMEKDPARRYQNAAELIDALRPHATRTQIKFDFRELVTLRAKQAKAKVTQVGKKKSGQRSSITSPSGWLQELSHHIAAGTDSFNQSETPAHRQSIPDPVRTEPMRTEASTNTRRNAYKGPGPVGWQLRILGTKRFVSLHKSQVSIGSSRGVDVYLQKEIGVDSLQCRMEFDGKQWILHQESMTQPTYVDGKVEAICALSHGSKITFGDKDGVTLTNTLQVAKNQKRLLLALIVLLVVLAAVAIALTAMKFSS